MRRNDVMCLVLGGGRGARLDPLTRYRSKPAVPVGGKFRLVDIPISNSLNSRIRKIFVITQFNSASLNTHIQRTYRFDLFSGGFVRILAAEQTTGSADWFQGTADAVRRSLVHIKPFVPRDVLILSGDQLYRMDFGPMIRQHRDAGATVTIAAKPVPAERTAGLGILQMDSERRVRAFLEKPQHPGELLGFELPQNLQEAEERGPRYAASMGIYVFRFDALCRYLENTEHTDFGKDLMPAAVRTSDVRSFLFRGYWEDIGTLRAYYEASLALTRPDPPFVFHMHGAPTYTEPRFLGASRIETCEVSHALVADGCYILGREITESIIGVRSVISPEARVRRTVMMGADGYEGDLARQPGEPPLGIGRGCDIDGAIIDKNARIGDGVRITPKPAGTNEDEPFYVVRDGVVIIPKNYAVPPGAVI
ncbi:MAG: sugar phosphate nucleotidyltransferase [Candidatus Eiseniibacteriota bacterium]